MADWPPMTPVRANQSQKRENTYLMLVDMFVDIVEPDIIQMILQNRNWDVDAALEDIMSLTNSSHSDSVQHANKTHIGSEISVQKKTDKNRRGTVQQENVLLHENTQTSKTENPFVRSEGNSQSKLKKQALGKPCQYKVTDEKKGNQSNNQPHLDQYNYVKAVRFPFDRAVMLIKDGVKIMIILRGPPGSGKSHLARKLLIEAGVEPPMHKRHIFSSDDFFVQKNVYVFVPDLLSQAHLWNQRSVATAIRDEISPIIIDNTNTQAWEMRVYAEMAVSAGYDLELLEPDTWWFNREGELAKRNVHGVPKAKIRNMIERYERNITPNMLMRQFDLRYSLLKAPPQPARNCKWRDKLSSQRNNKPKKKKSDFTPKPQNNFDNLNCMFQSLEISSPNYTQAAWLRPDLPEPSNSSGNACSPLEVKSSNVVRTTDESNIPPSYKNGDTGSKINFNESDTTRLFENMMNNSNVFLKSFSEFSKPSPDLVQTQVHQPRAGITSESVDHKSKDHFDFRAETKKLLEALNRPSASSEKEASTLDLPQLNVGNEALNFNVEAPKLNVSKDILVCKETEILIPCKNVDVCARSDKTFKLGEEKRDSAQEKVKVAHDLVEAIIDKVVTITKDTELKDHNSVNPITQLDSEGWDYVIWNDDNTFTYQRANSVPLTSRVIEVSDINTAHNITAEASTKNEVSDQHTENDEQLIKSNSNGDNLSKLISYEKEFYTPYNEIITPNNVNADMEHQNCLEISKESHKEETLNQLDAALESSKETGSGFPNGNRENLRECNSQKICGQKTTEMSVNSEGDPQSNVLEMMNDILCSMAPRNENFYSSFNSNVTSSDLETDNYFVPKSNIDSQGYQHKKSNITTPNESFVSWDKGNNWNYQHEKDTDLELTQSKPARNLRRPKLQTSTAVHQFHEEGLSTYLGNWNTVSNPAESWMMEKPVKLSDPKIEASALPQRSSPQRSRNNKKMSDSSTNTNYLDFSLIGEENPCGLKTLTGNINNILSDTVSQVKQNVVETLLLDKSTMTSENSSDSVTSYDITQITSLFPHIPEKYILDMVERCQGDIDWAVDLLLDSEHNMALVSNECEDSLISSIDEVVKDDVNSPSDENVNVNSNFSPKHDPKSPSCEQIELKKLLENSFVFDKSHYSDKILKVLKRKHPEYANLIENNQPQTEKCGDKLETKESSQDGCKTEDEVGDEEDSSSSGCETETEDDTLELVMNNDFILQLQQKFGNSPLPRITSMTPIVKLPVSFARQLFGYVMDSLQTDMDEQQSLIEDMIAQDEEVARLLHYQDQNRRPQLQEVMDLEVALAMHRAEQEEWKDKGNDTVAAKLSKNILLEKFPQVDPKMLTEVLHAHNYSLHDTINFLELSLSVDVEPGPSIPQEQRLDLPKAVRMTSVIVSDGTGANAKTADPMSEAQVHRDQAASYYSLRMECLSKAHEAIRSGNKTVATYYSQLAQIHKERMEQSNSHAAACLFSTHKTGANTLDLHFLHIREAEVVLDMFLDEVVTYISERNKRHQTVFLITGRGLRSIGGVSRIKPMVQRKLQGRGIPYNEVNPGMLSAVVRVNTPLSYTL